jgi:Subtilisin inhibitor-like
VDRREAGQPVGPLARGLLVVALLAAGGCGGNDSLPAGPRYDLTVVYWPTGMDGERRTATLTCDPDGGTHPDPAQACDALLQHEDALAPVSPDTACTEIYGGDQVATLSGAEVNASFSRANGCEIARWDALAPVLEIS